MLARIALVLLFLPVWSGCDSVSIASDAGSDPGVALEKPEGWESLEDESSATRLYYQFVDERRQVRFVERLDEVPEALRATVGFVEMDVPPPLSPGDAARARAAKRKPRSATVASTTVASSGIVLYTAEWCGACKKAKRHLERRGVDYEERDIDLPRYAEELVRKTGRRAIPVIEVDGRVLTGFSAKGYDQLIDRA